MKYALNLEPEALGNYSEFDEFEEEATDNFWELDEYSDHECESCSEFYPEYGESEWEAEVMRGRRVPQRPLRTRPIRFRPGMRRPRFRPRVIRRPGQVIGGPSVCTCPAPNCPQHGSEYVRWVQSALNQVMNLRLAVTGVMNPPTRSALRSFQEKQGLPVDGIAGPETLDALMGAKGGKSLGGEAAKPAEPAATPAEPGTAEPTPPASEFDFVWEVAGSDQLNGETCGCPSCRRGKPCPCHLKRKGFMINLRGIQPEAFEFEPESSFGEFEAPLFEVAIPRSIHRLDCGAGCPGGLTEAQCAPVVGRAISRAIKLAKTAADKLEALINIAPANRNDDAKNTARLFKAYFGHDPLFPVKHDGNKASAVSVIKRFRAVAKELGGGRRFVFRCVLATCPAGVGSTPGDGVHPPCCAIGSRAFSVINSAPMRNVVHLCPPFFALPEASRGGTILHELLHLRYPSFLHHAFRRANAHCFKAFALRVNGYGRDFPADCQCWQLNPGVPAQRDECRRRLGL